MAMRICPRILWVISAATGFLPTPQDMFEGENWVDKGVTDKLAMNPRYRSSQDIYRWMNKCTPVEAKCNTESLRSVSCSIHDTRANNRCFWPQSGLWLWMYSGCSRCSNTKFFISKWSWGSWCWGASWCRASWCRARWCPCRHSSWCPCRHSWCGSAALFAVYTGLPMPRLEPRSSRFQFLMILLPHHHSATHVHGLIFGGKQNIQSFAYHHQLSLH